MSSFITVSHAKGPKKDTNVEPQTVNVERLDFSELADDVTEGAGERIASGFDS